MAYTPLDESGRNAVWAEANSRAQRFGISPEQAIHNYARENNIDNSGVDTLMGFAPGSADAWEKQRDASMAAQPSAPPAQQPAPQGNSYTAQPMPASMPAAQAVQQPLYTGLSKNSSAADIAEAYREWSGANGGDTTDNQRAAANYLSNLGISRSSILDAYTAYKGQLGAPGGAAGGGVGGAQAQPTQPGQATPPPAPATNPFVPDTRIASASTTRFNPFDTVVDPNKTTQGLMNSMLNDPNSEYLKRARALSMERMTERGLGSSSMAQGAGVAAAIDAALGIASPDAQIFANANMQTGKDRNSAGAFNASAENDTGRFNAGNQNTAFRQAGDQQYDMQKMAAATAQDLVKMAAANGYDMERMARQHGYNLATMDKQQVLDLVKMENSYSQADREAQRKFGYDRELISIQQAAGRDIAGIESRYKNLTQASSSATSIVNNASNMVNQILLNERLTGDSTQPDPLNAGKFLSNKQVAIDTVKANMEKALSMIGRLAGDVDLTAFFDSLDGGVTP